MKTTPLENWIARKTGCKQGALTRAWLRSYQLRKLNETLGLAWENSHFYRNLLGLQKPVLSDLAELATLPFTTPEQLRSNPLAFLCVRQDDIKRIVTLQTSGTSGEPKRVFFTAADQELTIDFFGQGMSTLVDSSDQVLILLPGELPGSVGDLLREGLSRVGVGSIIHGPATDFTKTLEIIEKEQVTSLVGIPVQVLGLARLAAESGRSAGHQIKSVLLSTDHVPAAIVSVVESTWHCSVYNHYGMTEMGFGGGVDCAARAGYHLREADLLFEVVDSLTDRPAGDGQWGEVVCTTLTRTGMPLIRYRTGDVSRFLPGACPCGSLLGRLDHVTRRIDGGIRVPCGKTLWLKDLDEALFPIIGLKDFEAVFTEGRTASALSIKLKQHDKSSRLNRDRIITALLSIDALSEEYNQEAIKFDIGWMAAQTHHKTGTQKRSIQHIRKHHT